MSEMALKADVLWQNAQGIAPCHHQRRPNLVTLKGLRATTRTPDESGTHDTVLTCSVRARGQSCCNRGRSVSSPLGAVDAQAGLTVGSFTALFLTVATRIALVPWTGDTVATRFPSGCSECLCVHPCIIRPNDHPVVERSLSMDRYRFGTTTVEPIRVPLYSSGCYIVDPRVAV